MPKFRGTNTLKALPVSVAAGNSVNLTPQAKAVVPQASALTINGVTLPITDVRAMSVWDIAATINAAGIGVTATVEDGFLVIDNLKTINGDPVLLAFLGFVRL